MSLKKIDTPCIGICSTIYGDEVCRGCKRSYQEVIDWNTYSNEQRKSIFSRLWSNIEKACEDKIKITDLKKLRSQCDKYNIRYFEEQSPLCWAYYLLQEGHSKIQNLKQYGLYIQSAYKDLSLTELYQIIDQQLLDQAA